MNERPDETPIPDDLEADQSPWQDGAEEDNPWKTSEAPITDPGLVDDWTEPHHGVLVLVMGILGLTGLCTCILLGACSIVAIILGWIDLNKMKDGRMDPTGRSLTMAGLILGIVSLALYAIFILLYLGFIVFGVMQNNGNFNF